jgi:hypothetical protein
MSEPIKLYDSKGDAIIMYSPKVAKSLVAEGKLFEAPPPPPKTRKKKEE